MFNADNQTENAENIDEIVERENIMWAARIGLIVALLAILYSGYNIARILTIRGEIGNRQIVIETVTRTYRNYNKAEKRPTTVDYVCYAIAGGEDCLLGNSAVSSKKAGDPIETVQLWDGNVYYINTPYLDHLNYYLLWCFAAVLITLVCLIKLVFPRFNILRQFNDTRTTKLFDK